MNGTKFYILVGHVLNLQYIPTGAVDIFVAPSKTTIFVRIAKIRDRRGGPCWKYVTQGILHIIHLNNFTEAGYLQKPGSAQKSKMRKKLPVR